MSLPVLLRGMHGLGGLASADGELSWATGEDR
jgi:hypothetical protein